MYRGVIWGREVCMQGGPLSYLVYKRAFDSDLACDLLDAYRAETVTVETFLRFAWTMARTYDPAISDYENWLAEFDLSNFSIADSPVGVIDSAINAELFRSGASTRFGRFIRRIKNAIARWLGAISEHLRS